MAITTEPTPVIDGRAQIERILQSRIFHASEVLRNLLAYLSDKALTGTADSLKEYTIGLDALGKPESFDPRQESVVRMHTARLRQKLAEYYRTEGIDDPVIVDLPKGGFKITFESRPQAVVQPVQPPPPPGACAGGIALTPRLASARDRSRIGFARDAWAALSIS